MVWKFAPSILMFVSTQQIDSSISKTHKNLLRSTKKLNFELVRNKSIKDKYEFSFDFFGKLHEFYQLMNLFIGCKQTLDTRYNFSNYRVFTIITPNLKGAM